MSFSLRNFETSLSESVDEPIYALELDEERFGSSRGWKLGRFAAFDEPQARAICRFLRFMVTQPDHVPAEDAQRALDRYWGRFCSDE